MAQTFLTGYEVAFSIDADTVLALTASQFSISDGPASVKKQLFGASHALNKAGQGDGSFSASGVTTREGMPTLGGIMDASATGDNPIAIVVTMWGTGDTFTFAATCRVSIDASADGDVLWSIEGDIDGAVAYVDVP